MGEINAKILVNVKYCRRYNMNLKKIAIAGLIVGSLDITAAFVDAWFTSHVSPGKVLTGIAAATLGSENAGTGIYPIALGLLIHFFIAYSYTFFFYLVYPSLKNLFNNTWLIGIVYGVFIWASMRFLVLPTLSKIQFSPFVWSKAIKPMLILVFAIGIPLSLMAKKENKERN
ncbi:MAG TPA: hypothetical protein VMI35_04070 [Puia sp.]|nr:hypothetical protein [Puia sp.]